jgi:primosomal protein N'
MFKNGDIVKVLIPNVINTGYDYRLVEDADVGNFVRCTVMNRQYIGVIVGPGDSNLDDSKIKSIIEVCHLGKMSEADIKWIYKMSEWTLMAPGAVLRLIINVMDAFNPPKVEQLYEYNFNASCKMTDARQNVCDAFHSNDNDAMSVNDIQNIAKVSGAVVKTMIKNGILIPTTQREKTVDDFHYDYVDMKNVV